MRWGKKQKKKPCIFGENMHRNSRQAQDQIRTFSPSLLLYVSVVGSTIFYAVACWGTFTEVEKKTMNKLIRRAGSALRSFLNSLEMVNKRRIMAKFQAILESISNTLQESVQTISTGLLFIHFINLCCLSFIYALFWSTFFVIFVSERCSINKRCYVCFGELL